MGDLVFAAQSRDVGTSTARALRRQALVPAVIYGQGAPRAVALGQKELTRALSEGHFLNRMLVLDLGRKKERVLAREIQIDPVSRRPIHVDFLRVRKDTRVTAEVPCRFIHEDLSPGLKRGGVLNIVRHTVELFCAVDNLPEDIVVDLTGLEISDSFHISSVSLPEGARPTITDRDFTIATIVPPTVVTDMQEETAVASEEEAPAA